MRIAIISDHRGWAWAGCEELWWALASRALENGHQVAVFLCRRNVPENRIKPLRDRGMELHLAPAAGTTLVAHTRRLSWKAGNALSRLADPFRAIGRFRPDVVFYNSGDPIPDAGVLAHLRRSPALQWPYVVMVQNSHFLDPPPTGEYRDSAVRFFQEARFVLTAAARTVSDIEHILAARVAPMKLVRNPVNLQDTRIVPMPADATVGIASLGRLSIISKGQDLLIAALGSSKLREIAWRLSLYGDGSDAGHLLDLAKHYGVADRVTIKGYAGDIRAVWAENHLLALPSRFESAPLVVVEAMLCGRVCVVNDVGGVTDWIREPETGFVSPAAGIASFQGALERAFAARSRWTPIGQRAHEEADKLRDPDPGGTVLKILSILSAKDELETGR